MPSSQVGGGPAWHWPVVESHVSVPLQKFPSLQDMGTPVHVPFWQVSAVVQGLPSSHGSVLFA
jgi:hypothetical protein